MIACRVGAAVFMGRLLLGMGVCVHFLPPGLLHAEPQHGSVFKHFVRCDADRLLTGSLAFRFISFNIPDLHQVGDHFSFDRGLVWRWPNEYEITDALESVRQLGGNVVRIRGLSVYGDHSSRGDHVHVRGPGHFNEDAFLALDKVLQVANQKGVRLIVAFVESGHSSGGTGQYAAFRQKPANHFWTESEVIADFKKTVRFVLERTNTFTGVRYRDDKAILGWETGISPDAPPSWTHEIAAYIKSIDMNHLVIAGNSRYALRDESLNDPGIDVVTTSHDAADGRDILPDVRAAITAARGKKPYYVSELRAADVPMMRAVLDEAIHEEACGVLVRSLRFHNRDGGFYWHSESVGGKVLGAYHWPGFATGDAHAEREMIDLIRQRAAQIRGMETPPLPIPSPPHLLPISSPSQIRWQGSTGATSYDIHRSPSPDGPWQLVGQGISDAELPYRPLYADNRTELNQRYYYHLVAHNVSGKSPPSNIVGPVEIALFEMIDEFQDNLLLRQQQGPVQWVHEDARRAQEDFHRLRLRPGGSLTYQVGEPIRQVTLLAFVEGDKSRDLDFSISPDGTTFTPLNLERRDFPPRDGEEDFLLPIRYDGGVESAGIHFFRITYPEASGDTGSAAGPDFFDLSRLKIRFGGKN